MSRIDKFGGPQAPQTPEELHEKKEIGRAATRGTGKQEGDKPVTDADGVRRIVAPADAERLVSQAGFARSKKKKPGDLDLGDSSSAPIPLPQDDVDAGMWSGEALAQVQGQMGLQGAALARAKTSGGNIKDMLSMFQEIIGQSYNPTDEDAARLNAVTENPTPDAAGMQVMAQAAQAHFGLDIAGLSPGSQLMAASLLVAGQSSQVSVLPGPDGEPQKRSLDGERLLAGVQNVVDDGRKAVDDGRRMNDGVVKNLAMHRTFVAKR
jgi:hypothetical protein